LLRNLVPGRVGAPHHGGGWVWRGALGFLTVLIVAKVAALAALWLFFNVDPEGTVYPMLARSLVLENRFVIDPGGPACLWRGPIYPVLLAGVWSVVGIDRYGPVVAMHAVIGVATCLVFFMLARRFVPRRAAVAAALAVALYPPSNYYALRFMTESLFGLILGLFVFACYRADESQRVGSWALVGVIAGVAALTRPSAVLLAPATAAWVGLAQRRVHSAAVLLVGAIIVIAPWTIRNYVVSGEFVPVATGGGYSFWIGNRLASDGLDEDELDPARLTGFRAERGLIEGPGPRLHITPAMDRRFTAAALNGIAQAPWESLKLLVKRTGRLWFSAYTPERRQWNWVLALVNGTLLVGALIGLRRLVQQGRRVWPLVFPVVYIAIVHTLVLATVRYSVPVVPILIVLTVVAATVWWPRAAGLQRTADSDGSG